MSDETRRLLERAMTLPEDERLELATELLATVDGDEVEATDWEQAWTQELERRVEAAQRRGERGSDWTAVRERVLSRLASR